MIPRWADTDVEAFVEALAAVRREVEQEDVDDEVANELEDRDRWERDT